jgi:hypothetical protein
VTPVFGLGNCFYFIYLSILFVSFFFFFFGKKGKNPKSARRELNPTLEDQLQIAMLYALAMPREDLMGPLKAANTYTSVQYADHTRYEM